jgi:hypothetical protein
MEEKSDLHADLYNTLNRWKYIFVSVADQWEDYVK